MLKLKQDAKIYGVETKKENKKLNKMITSYKDISILKYQEIMAAIELNATDQLHKEEIEHLFGYSIAQWYNMLPLVTDHPKEYYKAIKFGELKKIVKDYSWLALEVMPDEWVKDFTVKGERFLVIQHATDWNAEQFVSMSNLTKDSTQIINNLHLILASMCVKEKGEVIDLTEFDRRSKLFQEHLCILTAYPVGFFFAAFLAKLSLSTPYSLHVKRQMTNAIKMNQASLDNAGDGTM